MKLVTTGEAQRAATAMLTVGNDSATVSSPKSLKFVNSARNGTPTHQDTPQQVPNVSSDEPCRYHLQLGRHCESHGIIHRDGFCWIPRAANSKKMSIPDYIRKCSNDQRDRNERKYNRSRSRSRSRSNPRSGDRKNSRSDDNAHSGSDYRDKSRYDNQSSRSYRSNKNDQRDSRSYSSSKRERDDSNSGNDRKSSNANAHSASTNGPPRTGGSTH